MSRESEETQFLKETGFLFSRWAQIISPRENFKNNTNRFKAHFPKK